MLLRLIQRYRGRVQTQAVATLLDVADSSSGKDCTVKADHREVECLLVALQDELEAVARFGNYDRHYHRSRMIMIVINKINKKKLIVFYQKNE